MSRTYVHAVDREETRRCMFTLRSAAGPLNVFKPNMDRGNWVLSLRLNLSDWRRGKDGVWRMKRDIYTHTHAHTCTCVRDIREAERNRAR